MVYINLFRQFVRDYHTSTGNRLIAISHKYNSVNFEGLHHMIPLSIYTLIILYTNNVQARSHLITTFTQSSVRT